MSKQEAVSTFEGGLVYDLNPMTTPNNVLVDCVNGTFLTFNSDELALQNDAGNTTIDYPVTTSTTNTTTETTLEYGALYNRYTATDVKNISSGNGWGVPGVSDFESMINYIKINYCGGNSSLVGGVLKEIGLVHWLDINEGATNELNFTAVGSGRRGNAGAWAGSNFGGLKVASYLWTKNTDFNNSFLQIIYAFTTAQIAYNIDPRTGFSIRLFRLATELELLQIDGTFCANYIGNDGIIYRTVKIGTQVWLTYNLCETKFADGSTIPLISDPTAWSALATSGMCYYNNDINNALTVTTTTTETTTTTHNPVQLTTGFYPLGIKEYGGVLYIVSGKQPNTAIPFVEGPNYNEGDIVYIETLGIKYYYESLTNSNGEPISVAMPSNMSWLYIGIEEDYINKYGEIEFGSYPSPEIINADRFDTSVNFDVTNLIDTNQELFKAELYSPQIINNSNFRAGIYVKFSNLTTPIVDNISYNAYTYDTITNEVTKDLADSVRDIYKVRLLHQLSNGFIDLTDDVWESYAKYVYLTYTNEELNMGINDIRFWFNDPNFKYYCPHNYKGKLALSVELESLDTFKVAPPAINYNVDTENYELEFVITYENQTSWNTISPYNTIIFYTTDGTTPDIWNYDIGGSTKSVTSFGSPISLTFAKSSYEGMLLKYKVLPIFTFDGVQIDRSCFPKQFLDLHTVSGSKLIGTETDDILLLPDPDYLNCEAGYTGYTIVERLTLQDILGNYRTNTFEASADKYQFYFRDTLPDPPPEPEIDFILGIYDLDSSTGKAIISSELNVDVYDTELPLASRDYVLGLVRNTIIKTYNAPCLYATLQITVNKLFGLEIPVSVIQNNIVINGIVDDTYPLISRYQIIPGTPYTVRPNSTLGVLQENTYWLLDDVLSGDKNIEFGLITDLNIIRNLLPPHEGHPVEFEYFINTNMTTTNFGTEVLSTTYSLTQTNDQASGSTYPQNIKGGNSLSIFDQIGDEVAVFDIVFSADISSTIFDNIPSNTVVEEGDDHLFLKNYDSLSI